MDLRISILYPSFQEQYLEIRFEMASIADSIESIDPELDYLDQELKKDHFGKRSYLVLDSRDGLEKVLKIGFSPIPHDDQREFNVMRKLNYRHVRGIPIAYRSYRGNLDENHYSAFIKEFIPGNHFTEEIRTREVYDCLNELMKELNRSGISIPSDFNGSNIIVSDNQPYFIDLEEVRTIIPTHWERGNNRKLNDLFKESIQKSSEHSFITSIFPVSLIFPTPLYEKETNVNHYVW